MMKSRSFQYGATAIGALLLALTISAASTRAAGGTAPSQEGDDGLTRHEIAVDTVDPAARQAPNRVTRVADDHLVLVPDAAQQRQRLFLFIDGTNTSPSMTQDILRVGAKRGYHAVSLAYPNGEAVAVLCQGSTDADCTGKVREEILTGEDLSPLVSIAKADSIEARLLGLLTYLNATYPREGWNRFLKGNSVDWSLVSAAGHSQGAGHVALLAKRHALLRAVMISGVADVTDAGRPAPWLSRANVTPVERQYGFSHVADTVVPLAVATASWNAIGLARFGPPQDTDAQAAPYSGAHELTTAVPAVTGVNAHLLMALDKFLPRGPDGKPVHAPVWEFVALP